MNDRRRRPTREQIEGAINVGNRLVQTRSDEQKVFITVSTLRTLTDGARLAVELVDFDKLRR